ncbi:CRISPR-associated helicase Cas3' [Thermodesulfobium narugense]|uniref:CRISPR-associated helicase Cas3' n=1 Tax=Thermodesulfobium narugense TaxID=184064 RepID=UPI001FE08F7F|nr:CRISPR-associated helicase Cas3' [Thermodesulfobium narugense]
MKTLSSSELFSHPGRLLEDHLISVADFIETFLDEKPKDLVEELKDLAIIVALTHDIGKATSYFQEYISSENNKIKLKNIETRHSLFSSICSFYLAKDILKDNILAIFAYIVVKRHHSNLIDILDELSIDEKELKVLNKQIDSIDDKKFSILCEKIKVRGLNRLLTKHVLYDWFNNFEKELSSLRPKIRRLNSDPRNYIKLNFLFSLLIDADKSDVVIGNLDSFTKRNNINPNAVDVFLKGRNFLPSPINDLRMKAYNEVVGKIESFNIQDKLYMINLPTGMGKTLISFSFALKLKKVLRENNIFSRIVYSLPFLSIIDQNSKVFEDVLQKNNVETSSNIILKHHHLSELYYKVDYTEFETNEAKILIEGWNSEIIITTFVQLFHTIFSNKNASLRKFHRFSNSIIILDEIQALPLKYWNVITNLFLSLTEELNIYLIISTATKPLIFNDQRVINLVDKKFYFNSLDRITIVPNITQKITLEKMKQKINFDLEKSILFIFNTISSAKKFYYLIKDVPNKTFLSSHILPEDRQNRINDIKRGKYQIVVSTQLVEAGVDVDFNLVVRDFAPIDSINQSSGRCNRNALNKGKVRIYYLKDDNTGKSYASYIYDPVLLDISEKILQEYKELKEANFLEVLDKYFSLIKEKKTQIESDKIFESMCKLKYDCGDNNDRCISVSNFHLIEEDYPREDIFIELNSEAEKIWLEYSELIKIEDRFLKKQKFEEIKSNFYKYVISVPSLHQNASNLPSIVNGFRYVCNAMLDTYYDRETGFILDSNNFMFV